MSAVSCGNSAGVRNDPYSEQPGVTRMLSEGRSIAIGQERATDPLKRE